MDRLIPKAKEDVIAVTVPDFDSMQDRSAQALNNEFLKLLSGKQITLDQAIKLTYGLRAAPDVTTKKAADVDLTEIQDLLNQYRREY